VRILIIGDMIGNIDEGMKKTTYNCAKVLSQKGHEVVVKRPVNSLYYKCVGSLDKFSPNVILSTHGPSTENLFLMKLLTLPPCQSKTVSIVTQANINLIFNKVIARLFRPDLALTQSQKNKYRFEAMGCKTDELIGGVAIRDFQPVQNIAEKRVLRKKYGIPLEDFVIVHVGTIGPERNLHVFNEISKINGITCVIVSPSSVKANQTLVRQLQLSGCMIINAYLSDIGSIYRSADCYLFPVVSDFGCIDTPLSVLEAMACNLPIICTRFGALPSIMDGVAGSCFYFDERKVIGIIDYLRSERPIIRTRERAMKYSWQNFGTKLDQILNELSSD